jgi:acyl-CoA reductase-like NAD-dependent aldehyde dehydrogenase
MSNYSMLIDGKLVDGDGSMEVINPATGVLLAMCPRASEAQLDAAVAAAKRAQTAWANLPIEDRQAALVRLADALEAQLDEFARLLTSEQGKPLAEAIAEVTYTAAFIRHFATQNPKVEIVENGPDRRVEIHRAPLGVVGAIVPWNFPLLLIAFKLPPALLTGNTIVVKPSPTTPLVALKLGELCASIFPPGVVNVVSDANDLGARLTAHPDIAKISFTGSTATGSKIMQSAASTIKRVTLELGGNDAAIVLADVDTHAVAPALFASAFVNAGQVCLAIKRLYVHEDIYDDICSRLVALATSAVVDDGLIQGAQIGPLQNKMQFEKVKGFLAHAHAEGNVIAGGHVIDRPGYFVEPTIVRDVTDGDRIVDFEQFGPILPVIKFSDAEDVLARANASPLGLGGSVWSKDIQLATSLASRMDVGMAWVNKHLDFGPNIPFGGAKQSGVGMELGDAGLAEFTQIRVLNVAL